MRLFFRNHALFLFTTNSVSFYRNMTEEHLGFFNQAKVSELKQVYIKEMETLAMSLLDISEGFMFEDEELVSVLGKSSHASDTEMYEEMIDIVRANPINQKPLNRGFNRYIRPLIQGKM